MKAALIETHKSVLVSEILSVFSKFPSPLSLLDCTFGRGGHSLAFLKRFPKIKIMALDQDEEAITYGHQELIPLFKNQLKLLQMNFHDISKSSSLPYSPFNSILIDLGVSSPQLEQSERGFSFYHRGPLDMRMDRRQTLKASDIVNNSSREELIHLFKEYGEIAHPHLVVNSLLQERRKKKIERVEELVKLILKHKSWQGKRTHPATAYFFGPTNKSE